MVIPCAEKREFTISNHAQLTESQRSQKSWIHFKRPAHNRQMLRFHSYLNYIRLHLQANKKLLKLVIRPSTNSMFNLALNLSRSCAIITPIGSRVSSIPVKSNRPATFLLTYRCKIEDPGRRSNVRRAAGKCGS